MHTHESRECNAESLGESLETAFRVQKGDCPQTAGVFLAKSCCKKVTVPKLRVQLLREVVGGEMLNEVVEIGCLGGLIGLAHILEVEH